MTEAAPVTTRNVEESEVISAFDEIVTGEGPLNEEVSSWLGACMEQFVTAEGEGATGQRVDLLRQMVDGVTTAYKGDPEAICSSFVDVTNNLLPGAIKGQMALDECKAKLEAGTMTMEDEDDAEYYAAAVPVSVNLLGQYMGLLAKDSELFEAEISTQVGAYRKLRDLADDKRDRGVITAPIPEYVRTMVEEYNTIGFTPSGEGQRLFTEAQEWLVAGLEQFSVAQGVGQQLDVLQQITNGVLEVYKGNLKVGRSSFRDVANNVLAGSIKGWEFSQGHDADSKPAEAHPDDAVDAAYGREEVPGIVDLLGQYMDLLAKDPEVFKGELLNYDGAYGDIRRFADEEKLKDNISSPILFYVGSILSTYEAENDVELNGPLVS